MTCPDCGSETGDRARFCASCGRSLEVETLTVGLPESAGARRRPASSSGWLTSSDSIDHGSFAPGAILDSRYRIIGLLGRGGMGEVYRADDLRLGQSVALKFLPADLGRDPVRLAQFHNEVRLARQMSHPAICRVYDIGEIEGRLFLSMEYVDGEDLATSLRRIGRFPEDKATDIARQLCAGIAAAHDRGVLHRDLKPANIMLDGAGKVRLMDFGLAAVGPVDNVRAGTPGYMAPEQLLGREVTARSDIYALGLVLYELFTGRRAFTATTIAELVNQHETGAIAPPTTIVAALDPAIERAILRCLDPDPARRPSSALTVSAALPGGDPLAAALAAGETPSPEMVAAAGEGVGLTPWVALAVTLAIVAGMGVEFAANARSSVLDRLRPEYSAEVLTEKARELLRQIGYPDRPADTARDFEWDHSFERYAVSNDKPAPRFSDLLRERPSPLVFWYRQSPDTLTGEEFHYDLLVPGIVTKDDPAPIYSGMIGVELDHQARLRYFEAIPPQREDTAAQSTSVNWDPLFASAGLDRAQLQPAEPAWTWLAASDTRAAWTGTWPGGARPLRVEAAALRGKPVAFMLAGPWTSPWRMPPVSSSGRETWAAITVMALAVVICVVPGLLARQNLRARRGDLHGAMRLAFLMSTLLLALWVCDVHLVASVGLFATFLVAVCTAVFYGVLMWTTYIALEPFVRRRWPQTIISWTNALTGHIRDPIVGRDVLFGVALGILLGLAVLGVGAVWPASRGFSQAHFGDVDMLAGVRPAIAALLRMAAYAVRNSLWFFFVLFLFRVILRNRWAGAAGFVAMFAVLNALQSDDPFRGAVIGFLYFGIYAAAVMRWGVVALTVAAFVFNVVSTVPAAFDLSSWYIAYETLLIAVVLGLTAWAFRTSTGGRWPWTADLA